MSILLFVVTLALVVGALVSLQRTSDDDVRFLSKFVWALIIVFLPVLGPLAWFVIGRRWSPDAVPRAPRVRRSRPATASAPVELTPEEEEAVIEAEIRFHEKQAEIRRLEAKLQRERDEDQGERSGKT
jgi:phospholipase D-like protein